MQKKKKRNLVFPKNAPVKVITNYFIKCPSCNTPLFNNLCDKMEKKKNEKNKTSLCLPKHDGWLKEKQFELSADLATFFMEQHFYLKE